MDQGKRIGRVYFQPGAEQPWRWSLSQALAVGISGRAAVDQGAAGRASNRKTGNRSCHAKEPDGEPVGTALHRLCAQHSQGTNIEVALGSRMTASGPNSDMRQSRPMATCGVETDCRDRLHVSLLRIVGPQQHPLPWHSRAGGGAVHSIRSGHGADHFRFVGGLQHHGDEKPHRGIPTSIRR